MDFLSRKNHKPTRRKEKSKRRSGIHTVEPLGSPNGHLVYRLHQVTDRTIEEERGRPQRLHISLVPD